jgi:hypothetical protein
MEPRFTKAEKKALRGLAGEAYARELDQALQDLASLFTDWRAKRIDGFALADAIHQFHEGPAQELWSRYEGLHPDLAVRLALDGGVLRPADVPLSLRHKLNATDAESSP